MSVILHNTSLLNAPRPALIMSRGGLVNLDSLARYFEQGDPPPTEQSQTAHGVRQIG